MPSGFSRLRALVILTFPAVYNKNHNNVPPGAVYVGRPSKWGNPFQIGRDGSRREVIEKYRRHLHCTPELLEGLKKLRGKDLVCWCYPKLCHADVLIEEANK